MTITRATAHALARKAVRDKILSCSNCDLPGTIAQAPVPFRGPTPNRVMVLGEAPGQQEDRKGEPFVGPSGVLLARVMEQEHLDLSKFFIANTACCYPAGPPSDRVLAACSTNLRAQIRLCDPEWILALGGTALKALWPRAKVTKMRGRVFRVEAGPAIGRDVFVTYHPAAVLRNESRYRTEFGQDLSTFRHILDGSSDAGTYRVKVNARGIVS